MSLNKKIQKGLYTGAFLTAVVTSTLIGRGMYDRFRDNPLNSKVIQEEVLLSNSINHLDETKRNHFFSEDFINYTMQENVRLTEQHQNLVNSVPYQKAIEKREKFLSAIWTATAGGLIAAGTLLVGYLGLAYITSPMREIEKREKESSYSATGLL